MQSPVVVGILARIQEDMRERVMADLQRFEGITIFSVAREEHLGILIEKPTLEGAMASLTTEVAAVPGILATWPVFSHEDSSDLTSCD